jgi:hypothetical protein
MPGSVAQPLTLVGTKRRSRVVGVCTAPGLNNVPPCGAAFPLGRVQGARGRGMWVEVKLPAATISRGRPIAAWAVSCPRERRREWNTRAANWRTNCCRCPAPAHRAARASHLATCRGHRGLRRSSRRSARHRSEPAFGTGVAGNCVQAAKAIHRPVDQVAHVVLVAHASPPPTARNGAERAFL